MSLLKTYTALKAPGGENWERASVLTDFSYPWLDDMPATVMFRALWDDNRFFFRFDVENCIPVISRKTDNKMEVTDSDRVEIFFRKDESMNPYYGLEMDSIGRILDYKSVFYREFDYIWQWPGKDDLLVQSQLLRDGYRVEGSVSLKSLVNLDLLKNGKLQAGLFRGECLRLPDNNNTFRWISWIKPDSPRPDFHIPSSFGLIELV